MDSSGVIVNQSFNKSICQFLVTNVHAGVLNDSISALVRIVHKLRLRGSWLETAMIYSCSPMLQCLGQLSHGMVK